MNHDRMFFHWFLIREFLVANTTLKIWFHSTFELQMSVHPFLVFVWFSAIVGTTKSWHRPVWKKDNFFYNSSVHLLIANEIYNNVRVCISTQSTVTYFCSLWWEIFFISKRTNSSESFRHLKRTSWNLNKSKSWKSHNVIQITTRETKCMNYEIRNIRNNRTVLKILLSLCFERVNNGK